MSSNKISAYLKFTQKVRALRGGLHGCGGAWRRCSSLNRLAIRHRRALPCAATTAHSTPSNCSF